MEVPGTLSNSFPTLTPLPLSPELGWNESEWHMVNALLRLCDLRSALQLSLHMAPGVQRLLHRFAQTGSEHDSVESDQLRMELGVRSARLMQSLSERYHQPEHTNASRGTWYYEDYMRWQRSFPSVYRDEPELLGGYTSPRHFDKVDHYTFRLRPGQSAAEGLEAFLGGLTVLECHSAITALQYRTLLDLLGPDRFDSCFSSSSAQDNLLLIEPELTGRNPLSLFMRKTDTAHFLARGSLGARPALQGEWYYFGNHPKYLLKHPAGSWQGSNAIYVGTGHQGEQLWQGFGLREALSEPQLLAYLAERYSVERTDADQALIERWQQEGVDPALFEIDGLFLNDRIDAQDILSAPMFRSPLDGMNRIGGFQPEYSHKLDVRAVRALLDGRVDAATIHSGQSGYQLATKVPDGPMPGGRAGIGSPMISPGVSTPMSPQIKVPAPGHRPRVPPISPGGTGPSAPGKGRPPPPPNRPAYSPR